MLQGEGGTVESLLASTASLTSTIADRDQVIGQVVDNLNQVLQTVNSRDDQLSSLIGTLRRLVSGLPPTGSRSGSRSPRSATSRRRPRDSSTTPGPA